MSTRRILRPISIDLYLLKLMLRPMIVALIVAMVALMTERLFRILDLVSNLDASVKPIITMTLGLAPHYLSLALPAAFCIGIITTLATLANNDEIDAFESAGWSLRRVGAAFVMSGAILAIVSLLLSGILQPYARYAYYAAKHAVQNAGWNGKIEEGVFLDTGEGIVISARDVDPTGRFLTNVFVLLREDGATLEDSGAGDTAITSKTGIVVKSEDGESLRLRLHDGRSLSDTGALDFNELTLSHEFDLNDNPFRERSRPRELTLVELYQTAHASDDPVLKRTMLAEFHSRLVRALSLIGIAMAAVPLGVAAKRAPVWPRMTMAIAILAAYHNAVLTLKELASDGKIDPAFGLWSCFAIFMAAASFLFFGTSGQGRSPLRIPLRIMENIAYKIHHKRANTAKGDER